MSEKLNRIVLKNSKTGSTHALFLEDGFSVDDLANGATKLHPYNAYVQSTTMDTIGGNVMFAQVVINKNRMKDQAEPHTIYIESVEVIEVHGRMVRSGVILELTGGAYDTSWSQLYRAVETFDIRKAAFVYRNTPRSTPETFAEYLIEKGLIKNLNSGEIQSIYVGCEEVYVEEDDD